MVSPTIRPKHQGLPSSHMEGLGENFFVSSKGGVMQACFIALLFCVSSVCRVPQDRLTTLSAIESKARSITPLVSMPLIYAVAAAESRYNASAVSPVGAYGTFQIMPITERHVNIKHSASLNRLVPEDNIEIGIRYLDELYIRYGNVKDTLVAYNWGPSNVGRLVLPVETETYISRIERMLEQCS